jgi:hypothetical protein
MKLIIHIFYLKLYMILNPLYKNLNFEQSSRKIWDELARIVDIFLSLIS